MAEKRGLEHINLVNDFNTAGCLEICKEGKWVRVISKDFRAFNGPRRITEPTNVELGNVNVPMMTYDYYGPVYEWGTNNEVAFTNSGSIEVSKGWLEARKISESRGQ